MGMGLLWRRNCLAGEEMVGLGRLAREGGFLFLLMVFR